MASLRASDSRQCPSPGRDRARGPVRHRVETPCRPPRPLVAGLAPPPGGLLGLHPVPPRFPPLADRDRDADGLPARHLHPGTSPPRLGGPGDGAVIAGALLLLAANAASFLGASAILDRVKTGQASLDVLLLLLIRLLLISLS